MAGSCWSSQHSSHILYLHVEFIWVVRQIPLPEFVELLRLCRDKHFFCYLFLCHSSLFLVISSQYSYHIVYFDIELILVFREEPFAIGIQFLGHHAPKLLHCQCSFRSCLFRVYFLHVFMYSNIITDFTACLLSLSASLQFPQALKCSPAAAG